METTNIRTEYVKVKENNAGTTHLKVEFYYSLGGMNFFTYAEEPRGYYASVSPVERDGIFESYACFSGIKRLLLPVARRSKKAAMQADAVFKDSIDELIKVVLKKQGLELEEDCRLQG